MRLWLHNHPDDCTSQLLTAALYSLSISSPKVGITPVRSFRVVDVILGIYPIAKYNEVKTETTIAIVSGIITIQICSG